MNLKLNDDIEPARFGDEWGFYIDIDNEGFKNLPNNEDKIRKKYKVKHYDNYDRYYNDIYEEYEYHIQNNKNGDDDNSIDLSKNNDDKNNYSLISSFIVQITSTTIITTAALTYVIFFVL